MIQPFISAAIVLVAFISIGSLMASLVVLWRYYCFLRDDDENGEK